MKAKIMKIGITMSALFFFILSPSWADGRHHQKREKNSGGIDGPNIKNHRIQHQKNKWQKDFYRYPRTYHQFHRPVYRIRRYYLRQHYYWPIYKHRHFHYHY